MKPNAVTKIQKVLEHVDGVRALLEEVPAMIAAAEERARQDERQIAEATIAGLNRTHSREIEQLSEDHAKELKQLNRAHDRALRELRVSRDLERPSSGESVSAAKRGTKPGLEAMILAATHYTNRWMSREEVAYYACCSSTSGPVTQAFARLVASGNLLRNKSLFIFEKASIDLPSLGSREDVFNRFCQREGGTVELLLRSLVKLFQNDPDRVSTRTELLESVGRSTTSGPSTTAIARLIHLDVIEKGEESRTIKITPWFYKAIVEIQIRVHSNKTGETLRVNARTGSV